ncbi:FAD-dependent oxidoreductase [Candidatus Entotheonella serta]|nr:FAD-dependent oxidoreductase [Candidatus Entotheonella serta]
MTKHVIIGAGPAGLTAAWELVGEDQDILILEADPCYVGGIARTVEYRGNRFDMGGHRFYSKSDAINRLWNTMLPSNFIQVPRLSRICYNKKFLPYPLQLWPTLKQLGFRMSGKIVLSYAYARLFPRKQEASFEDWVVNRFGYQLYSMFFKTYTEKVWGLACTEINKDWAAQRIRDLSMLEVIRNALIPAKDNPAIKTLITTFTYPRLGPGQLWEAVQDQVLAKGHRVEHDKEVVRINHRDGVVTSMETLDGGCYEGSHFYSTMTLKDLLNSMNPPPPPEVLRAGNALVYRDFLTVALIVDRPHLFSDNWIYIHDPSIFVGRIQNYKNWSPDMVADLSTTCLGMEYFCSRGDALWILDDEVLIKLAGEEVERIGLAPASDCIDGCVVRIPNAYPVYDGQYKQHRETIKTWLNSYFTNLYPAGRGGLHNYNSQDHSMMAAILSVRNMREHTEFDVWSINTDEEYAEEGTAHQDVERRLVPQRLSPKA